MSRELDGKRRMEEGVDTLASNLNIYNVGLIMGVMAQRGAFEDHPP